MDIKTIDDACFLQYGRVITDVDVSELMDKMQNTPLPDDVIYIPSDNDLESTKVCRIFSDSVYGQMPIHIAMDIMQNLMHSNIIEVLKSI